MEYIQSKTDCQAIANRIQFTNLVTQYNTLISEGLKPQEIQNIWGANELFLDCSEQEALTQYSLVGIHNGKPVIPLKGVTKIFDIPRTIEVLNDEGVVIAYYGNCIIKPSNLENYDLSEFNYTIIEV